MRIAATVAIVIGMTIPTNAEVTATFPISIPQECVVLAQREGVPTVIENQYQAAKAKLKLARLSGKDPLVQECRAAVERAKASAAAREYQPPSQPAQGNSNTIGQSRTSNVSRE